jgi:hypothetical protein
VGTKFADGIADPPLPFNGGRFATTDAELVLVKRRILWLYIVAPSLSFAALLVGFEQGWSRLVAAGTIGFGATAFAIGERAMTERCLMFIVRSFRGERRRYVLYEGVAALPFGFAYVVAGLSLTVPAIAFLTGTGLESMRELVFARPSYALLPIGAFLLAHGLGFAIGFAHRGGSLGRRLFDALLNLPGRLAGVILLAWGVLVFCIGLYEWLLPDAFDRLIAGIARGHLPSGL